MYDQGLSLNTMLVHTIILKKSVCDLGVFFRVEICTRKDPKDSLRRCWYNNLAKSFLTHPFNYLHLNANNWKLPRPSSSLVKYWLIRL